MSRLAASLTVAVCVALLPACDAAATGDRTVREQAAPTTRATWDKSADSPFPGTLSGRIEVSAPDGAVIEVRLRNARFTAIPRACEPSTIVRRKSRITDANSRLLCTLRAGGGAARTVDFEAVAVAPSGAEMGGTVRNLRDDTTVELPELTADSAPASLRPRLRLVSSPDFLNADVGNLGQGPSLWRKGRSANSINKDYRRALAAVLNDWQATAPQGVLVAGDLVEGHWGTDDLRTGNFGPVGTLAEQLAALDRAARTYYPQYLQRFRRHDLALYPAPGDHEYGDNPWPAAKRARAAAFRRHFARYFTAPGGKPTFADHPQGPHALTAYAGRPLPDVQVISIDPFDITPERARIGLDKQQRTWLRGVLRRAQRDEVRWIVVQGHVPILGPVRTRGSSSMYLPGGARSKLWQMFEKYGVDLYLSGEAHDVTVLSHGGVTQITHGGLFAYGLTNALLLDFYDDFVYLSLRDYDMRVQKKGPRLWQTRDEGIPRRIKMRQAPFVIGTGVVPDRGGIRQETGTLRPGGPAPRPADPRMAP